MISHQISHYATEYEYHMPFHTFCLIHLMVIYAYMQIWYVHFSEEEE